MTTPPELISHALCPYVQRAAIVAAEKHIEIERRWIDLADKPDWFLRISPTGKVPLLRVTDAAGTVHVLFESAVIAEYLDESTPGRLMPEDPIQRALHRAWVEFASGTLAEIAGLYNAADKTAYDGRVSALIARFVQLEAALAGRWFGGEAFGLVDAAFGPVFRYLDAFERLLDLRLADLPRISAWRRLLAARPSVIAAAHPEYVERLDAFLHARPGYLGKLLDGG